MGGDRMTLDTSNGGGIGGRVRAARGRLGWNREALAFHSGLSWSAITQVESGRRTNVRPGTLAALARALGVSTDYLVTGTPPRSTMLEHATFAYGSDDQFRAVGGAFLAEGVERSEALIAVTTQGNIELLREHLGTDAGRVEFVEASSFFRTPIAALEGYRAFADAQLERGVPWVRVLGEPVWDGRSAADVHLWTRYESLLNLAFSAYPLTVVCTYDERSVAPEIISEARHTHPKTVDSQQISTSPEYTDPERFALRSQTVEGSSTEKPPTPSHRP